MRNAELDHYVQVRARKIDEHNTGATQVIPDCADASAFFGLVAAPIDEAALFAGRSRDVAHLIRPVRPERHDVEAASLRLVGVGRRPAGWRR
jgi:hypothetical protein